MLHRLHQDGDTTRQTTCTRLGHAGKVLPQGFCIASHQRFPQAGDTAVADAIVPHCLVQELRRMVVAGVGSLVHGLDDHIEREQVPSMCGHHVFIEAAESTYQVSVPWGQLTFGREEPYQAGLGREHPLPTHFADDLRSVGRDEDVAVLYSRTATLDRPIRADYDAAASSLRYCPRPEQRRVLGQPAADFLGQPSDLPLPRGEDHYRCVRVSESYLDNEPRQVDLVAIADDKPGMSTDRIEHGFIGRAETPYGIEVGLERWQRGGEHVDLVSRLGQQTPYYWLEPD